MVIKELGDLYSKFGKRVPWHVDWEITYRCQNKCKHCYLMHKDKDIKLELDTRIVHRTLDELKQLGTVEIGFTGGDPFLYQGFFDVLSHASKNNFNIIIFTSGVGISQHDIKSLLQHNIVKMEFTFFGDNEKTHDAFTSNDGSFNRMLETVSLLHERGIHCIAKMIITSQNKNQVQNLKHRMENMGVSFSFDPHIWRPYHGTEDDIKNYRISSEDMLKYYQWQHINYVSNSKNIQMCIAGRQKLGITPEGFVNPCGVYGTNYVLGSLKKDTIIDIWENSEETRIFVERTSAEYPIKKCITCENRIYCDWCPGLSAWCNDNINEPYEELCKDTWLKRKSIL